MTCSNHRACLSLNVSECWITRPLGLHWKSALYLVVFDDVVAEALAAGVGELAGGRREDLVEVDVGVLPEVALDLWIGGWTAGGGQPLVQGVHRTVALLRVHGACGDRGAHSETAAGRTGFMGREHTEVSVHAAVISDQERSAQTNPAHVRRRALFTANDGKCSVA